MKVTSLLFTALVGALSVSAAAAPVAEAKALPVPDASPDANAEAAANRWCGRPGEYCWKVKRAADAMANAMAGADAEATRWCGRPGEYCWTKRDAEANPEAHSCTPGSYCWKAKRDLEHLQAIQDQWTKFNTTTGYPDE